MQRDCYLRLLVSITLVLHCSAGRIGRINNGAIVTINPPRLMNYTSSCDECVCAALHVNTTAAYVVGLNCYRSTKTCALFTNYSSTTRITVNPDSTFLFRQRPSFLAQPSLIGVTVAGYGNGSSGTALDALNIPWGLALGADRSLFVSDLGNARVLRLSEGNRTGSIVAGTGVSGSNNTQFVLPVEIAVDRDSNIYVNDDFNYRIMLWGKNATFGVIKAGTGIYGSALDRLSTSAGLALDSRGDLYVSDHGNHRVVKWPVNATMGTLVAGITGNASNSSMHLNQPYGLYLDENNSWIYVADSMNHRVQRFDINGGAVGVTVAGGNGRGAGENQLDSPYAVFVSPKTGDIYVADSGNHRIALWRSGAATGVTIAGVTGVNGTNATLLNKPTNVMLSKNETFLYVSDGWNHRLQRFELA